MVGTNWTAITTFEQMLSAANAESPFWTMMLFMIWAIMIITFIPLGFTTSLITSSFVGGILGIFLVYMGLVSWKWVLGLFALSLVVVIIETLFAKKET